MTAAKMSLALDDSFEAFLFAPVGEERNGMTLSVLSALSRLQIDPWDDAARLSRLSKESAIVALGQSIARLPLGKWQLSDATEIATRLVELLPKEGARPQATTTPALPAALKNADWKRTATMALAGVTVGIAIYLLFGLATRTEYRPADSGAVHVESDRTTTP